MKVIHSSPRSEPLRHEPARLVDSCSGQPPRLRTSVSLEHDARALRVVFDCEDDGVVATLTQRDADLYTEDVLEVFLAPIRLEEYLEIEVNPLGAFFDAKVSSPDRHRSTMNVDRSWNCAGLRADIVTRADGTIRTTIVLPWEGLGVSPPSPGTEWRGNFYRIDRSEKGNMFAAWSPTGATPPDFHVPERFGKIVF